MRVDEDEEESGDGERREMKIRDERRKLKDEGWWKWEEENADEERGGDEIG